MIAGSVGSGKGMLISSIILSLIVNYSSAELMLAIVDTRIGYLSRFQGIPHLVSEIPNTVNDALELFGKISYELKYRVNLIKNAKVSSIQEYNKLPNITSPIKPFIIVINDFNDLLNENSEYVLKFLKTLNNYSNLLNCRLIAITDNIHPLYIENDFNLIFGFKINSLFADNSIINKNYLNKLHGDGDFILFDSIQPISILTRGLACYVDSNELMHIVNKLKNLYS